MKLELIKVLTLIPIGVISFEALKLVYEVLRDVKNNY